MDKSTAQALVDKNDGNISAAAREAGVGRTKFRGYLGYWTGEEGSEGTVKIEKEEITVLEEHRLKTELRNITKMNKDLVVELDKTSALVDLMHSFSKAPMTIPKWMAPGKTKGDRAIATSFLSDLHFDEVVKPEQVNFSNAYNRRIGELRLQKFFDNTLRMTRDYCGGIKIDGLILPLGGDIVSGDIHEELQITNETHILETVLHWTGQLAAGINMLSAHVEDIHIPCFAGNHGRMTKKPVMKDRNNRNFDWFIYKLLQDKCPGVTFDIPQDTSARWKVYNTKYHGTHGDRFRGGGGIGGIMVPIRRGAALLHQAEAVMGSPFDILILGHFHQYITDDGAGILVNGSLKGYDEFAMNSNFGFQPPQQSFWLTDPDHGITLRAPIRVLSDAEGWQRDTA